MSDELKLMDRGLEFANAKQVDELWKALKDIEVRLKKLEQMMVNVVNVLSIQQKLFNQKDTNK